MVRRWDDDERCTRVSARVVRRLAAILDLTWLGGQAGSGEVRAAVYALVGQFAESATYVRQRRDAKDRPVPKLRFEVGTGELDGAFASHGHTVLITVT